MKQYLIENRPRFTITLVLILLISGILTTFLPWISNLIILNTNNLTQPSNWYRFFTYPLIVGGLFNWLWNSIVLLLTGYVFENRTTKGYMIAICLISTFIGGMIYSIFNQGTLIGLIGPSIISWGYISAIIVCGLKFWKTLNVYEKVILILSMISLLSIIAPENIGIILSQIIVVTFVAILALTLKIFK
jgi:membrane associated rhomboid family serine protease